MLNDLPNDHHYSRTNLCRKKFVTVVPIVRAAVLYSCSCLSFVCLFFVSFFVLFLFFNLFPKFRIISTRYHTNYIFWRASTCISSCFCCLVFLLLWLVFLGRFYRDLIFQLYFNRKYCNCYTFHLIFRHSQNVIRHVFIHS